VVLGIIIKSVNEFPPCLSVCIPSQNTHTHTWQAEVHAPLRLLRFSLISQQLLSSLSKRMGCVVWEKVSVLPIDQTIGALSSLLEGTGWRSQVQHVILKTVWVNDTHTHMHTPLSWALQDYQGWLTSSSDFPAFAIRSASSFTLFTSSSSSVMRRRRRDLTALRDLISSRRISCSLCEKCVLVVMVIILMHNYIFPHFYLIPCCLIIYWVLIELRNSFLHNYIFPHFYLTPCCLIIYWLLIELCNSFLLIHLTCNAVIPCPSTASQLSHQLMVYLPGFLRTTFTSYTPLIVFSHPVPLFLSSFPAYLRYLSQTCSLKLSHNLSQTCPLIRSHKLSNVLPQTQSLTYLNNTNEQPIINP